MNTNNNSTKLNKKLDVALFAFRVAILETVLVVIITQLAVGGMATVKCNY